MKKVIKLHTSLKKDSYVEIENGLISSSQLAAKVAQISHYCVVITHDSLKDLFAQPLIKQLREKAVQTKLLTFKNGGAAQIKIDLS